MIFWKQYRKYRSVLPGLIYSHGVPCSRQDRRAVAALLSIQLSGRTWSPATFSKSKQIATCKRKPLPYWQKWRIAKISKLHMSESDSEEPEVFVPDKDWFSQNCMVCGETTLFGDPPVEEYIVMDLTKYSAEAEDFIVVRRRVFCKFHERCHERFCCMKGGAWYRSYSTATPVNASAYFWNKIMTQHTAGESTWCMHPLTPAFALAILNAYWVYVCDHTGKVYCVLFFPQWVGTADMFAVKARPQRLLHWQLANHHGTGPKLPAPACIQPRHMHDVLLCREYQISLTW